MKTCKQCRAEFEITTDGRAFYRKIDVPEPSYCAPCRQIQLMAWRNERTFYTKACAWCKRSMVSCFSPKSPFTVLCAECWWGDKFDPLKYGRDFDFSRPFFDQFWEHMTATPVGNLFIASSENSDYTNYAVSNKNCYMVTGSDYNQDCFYADNSNENSDSCDVSFVNKGELMYECVDCVASYQCFSSQNLKNCNFCMYSADLIGCANCIGCVGLRNAEYCIFNKKLPKAEYENYVRTMRLDTAIGAEKMAEAYEKFRATRPRRFSQNINAENSTGNYIVNSKNCRNCFDVYECEECAHGVFGFKTKDSRDFYGVNATELAYQCGGVTTSYGIQFCAVMWPGSNEVYYSFLARTAKHCLGGVSLQKNKYCIFNKQYTKDEYEKLFKKIKAHMIETGEFGNFFPLKIAPWGYNETIAQDFHPLTKEQAITMPARWEDETPGTFGKETMKAADIPDDIASVPTGIVNEVLACEKCKRNYKIIEQELKFYKRLKIALPRTCPTCRYHERIRLRNPRALWKRPCMCSAQNHDSHAGSKCRVEVETAFAPDRKEQILCEECYSREVG